jgi:hypothetical protein
MQCGLLLVKAIQIPWLTHSMELFGVGWGAVLLTLEVIAHGLGIIGWLVALLLILLRIPKMELNGLA